MHMIDAPLGITMGDANGVGAEILLRYFAETGFAEPTVVYGDLSILTRGAEHLGLDVNFNLFTDLGDLQPKELNIVDLRMLSSADFKPGTLSKATGFAAYHYVEKATQDSLAGKISGLVTLPINKQATQLSFPSFSGHTDFIAKLCQTPKYAMMLATEKVAVSHVSAHVSLLQAIQSLNPTRIDDVIRLTHSALRTFREEPRIAVCGLNPHAGEHGLFGDEEEHLIEPAIQRAIKRNWIVSGPHPADTIFYRAIHADEFDGIICMYHDQGHAPMKLYAFHEGVNVTIGLPIVRTSVDHGTAFDIAWQGKALTTSFHCALKYARKLLAH